LPHEWLGAAIGIASFVAPLYISEIAPVDIRGMLVSINQLALTSGIVVSYLIDYVSADTQAWRWVSAMAVIPGVAFGFGPIFIPDSPRWLVSDGRAAQAYATPRQAFCCGESISSERLSLRTLLEPSPCETRTPQASAQVRAVSAESPE
jgi:MFS family permease